MLIAAAVLLSAGGGLLDFETIANSRGRPAGTPTWTATRSGACTCGLDAPPTADPATAKRRAILAVRAGYARQGRAAG